MRVLIYAVLLSLVTALLLSGCVSSSWSSPHLVASVGSGPDGFTVHGIEPAKGTAAVTYEIQSGPTETIGSFQSKTPDRAFQGLLAQPLSRQGTVMLWIQPDRSYGGGVNAVAVEQPLVSVEGLFEFEFLNTPSSVHLYWKWVDPVSGVSPARILLPHVQAKQWYHLTFTWDADAGLFNAYLNGTPFRIEGTTVEPWQMPLGRKIKIFSGLFAMADVKVLDRYIGSAAIAKIIGKRHVGAYDEYLGAVDLGKMSVEHLKGEMIYHNSFSVPADIAGWRMEGPGDVGFADGWMAMTSREPDSKMGHIVHWCDREFPESFIAEWKVQVQSEFGLCIIFFAATGLQGQDVFSPELAPRNGTFGHYIRGDIRCYHISYFATVPFEPSRPTSNMRKNPGAFLVTTGPVGIPAGSETVHQVILAKINGRIMLGVDGRKVIDFTDDPNLYGPAYGAGKIGFRQMQWTVARYDDFRVYEVVE